MPSFSQRRFRDYYEKMVPNRIDFCQGTVEPRHLGQLVFDLAATCNMGCTYCFADRGRYGVRNTDEVTFLQPDIADRIIDKTLRNCSSISHLKFFGGEPLLNHVAIQRICERIRDAVNRGKLDSMPSFNVVTNGTVFSPAIAKTLREYSIEMVVSIDGPKNIHDAQRKFTNGSGTYDRIVTNIHRFAQAQCKLGMLEAVYSPMHIELGYSLVSLYKHLVDAFGEVFDYITLHPMTQPTLDELPDTQAKSRYVAEMRTDTRQLYEYMILQDFQSATKAEFRNILGGLMSESRGENLCGTGYDAITVKPDGSVYSCYVFTGEQEYLYGNILADGFWEQFRKGGSPDVMEAASRFRNEACNSCDIQRTCTHCLSGMDANEGLSHQLPDVNCEFNIGQLEGFFGALEIVRRQGRFEELCTTL